MGDRSESTPIARPTKNKPNIRSRMELPQISSIKVDKTKDEQADLADQIAALRIIASKGKDTKYLSIRGNSHASPPPPVESTPFCGAVSSDARTNIVSEIITTEETYVNDLEI